MTNHKKQAIFCLTFLLISALLCGCGRTVINTEADEIKLYSWEYTGKQTLAAELSFENDSAALTIENNGEHCVIEGLCVFGDQTFIIVDNTLKNKFVFGYTLSGKTLVLDYDGSTVSFDKKTEEES